ncbi:MAG: hypothetical protein KDA67_11120 [Rhodobacteraceae bacterium]|nr:hypothetical protein [Paracoccaceae bacterium]
MQSTNSLTFSVLVTVVPKVLNGALTLLLSLILVVVFPIEQYGYYAYAINVILLADAIIGTPFDLAVIRVAQPIIKSDPSTALAIERQAFFLKLLLATLIILMAFALFLVLDIKLAQHQRPMALILVTGAAILGLLTIRSLLLHMQMREAFAKYGKVELLHVALKMVPAFALVGFGMATPLNILLCFFLAPIIATGAMLFQIKFEASEKARSLDHIPSLARSLAWYLPTLALGATLARMDILLMGGFLPAKSLGAYGAAVTLASVPDMIGMYLGIVLTPRVVKYAHAGQLGPFFRRNQLLLMAVSAACYVGLLSLSGFQIQDHLPDKFTEIFPIFLILVPGTLFAMTTSAMALPFVLLSNRRFLLSLDVCIVPVVIVAYLWVIPNYGVSGTAYLALAVMMVRSIAVLAAAWLSCDKQHSFGSS